MNPHIQSTFEDYFEDTSRHVQLKDVEQEFRDKVAAKIEALYAKLKKDNLETKFATIFQVDETMDRIEEEIAKSGKAEDLKLTQFFKHSNQQTNIIVNQT